MKFFAVLVLDSNSQDWSTYHKNQEYIAGKSEIECGRNLKVKLWAEIVAPKLAGM